MARRACARCSTMSSGVAFSETYGPDDDLSTFVRGLFGPNAPAAAALLRGFNTREAPEGTRFHYASSETEVLGLVLAAATGQRLTDYASERLWKPMGAEADAAWSADRTGRRPRLLLLQRAPARLCAARPAARQRRRRCHSGALGDRGDLGACRTPGARRARRRRSGATAIRPGCCRRAAACSRCAAFTARRSSSIPPRSWCWCTRPCAGVERSGRTGTDDAVVRAGQAVRREQ